MINRTPGVRSERAPVMYTLSGLGRQRDTTRLVHTTGLIRASSPASARSRAVAFVEPYLEEGATVDVYPISDSLLHWLPEGNRIYAESLVAFTPTQSPIHMAHAHGAVGAVGVGAWLSEQP